MPSQPPDYFPMPPGLALEYAYRGKDGQGLLKLEVLSSAAQAGELKARLRETVTISGKDKVSEYDVVRKPDGVYGPWGKEFPLPAAVGLKWTRNERQPCEITALDHSVAGPEGTFTGCLRVQWDIAEGNGGDGEFCYAPGVGLVYASSSEAGDFFEMVLRKRSGGGA